MLQVHLSLRVGRALQHRLGTTIGISNVPSQHHAALHDDVPGQLTPGDVDVGPLALVERVLLPFDRFLPMMVLPPMTSPVMILRDIPESPNSLTRQCQSYERTYTHDRQGWSSSNRITVMAKTLPRTEKMEQTGPQPTTTPNQAWWDSSTHHTQDTSNKSHPAARLSAAPKSSHTKLLTAYSHFHSHFSKPALPGKEEASAHSQTCKTSMARRGQITPAFIPGINPIARWPCPSQFSG